MHVACKMTLNAPPMKQAQSYMHKTISKNKVLPTPNAKDFS